MPQYKNRSTPRRRPHDLRFFVILVGLVSSCAWLQGPPRPEPRTAELDGIAAGVTVVATPFHRVSPNPTQIGNATRVMILYVRIESIASDAYWLQPTDMKLLQPDGTVGVGLDRERVQALLDRSDLFIVEADPAAVDPTGMDRTGEVQRAVRETIQSELLTECEVQRDRAVGGYLVMDTGRSQPNLAGATLQIGLTRVADGAQMRQSYRFETPPLAAADADPSS